MTAAPPRAALPGCVLGLRREPDPAVRAQLKSQMLFCAIIDLQDTLQQRHAASMIEEWEETTLPDRHKDVLLRAWTKYVAGGAKRTTSLDCVRLYETKLGIAETAIFTPNGRQHDLGVMGLTLAKPVESD